MLPELPVEVLLEVFLHMPAHCVVCVCRLVCREWRDIADSVSLWKKRCYREGHKPHDVSQQPTDWRLFYFLSRKKRNLLKNPIAEEKFHGWRIVKNGGDRWSIGDVTNPLPDENVRKFFVTSYGSCMKSQLINLAEEGYNSSLMDLFQPDIVISDWYSPRWDCGSFYEVCVELLNNKKKVLHKFCPSAVTFEQWNDMPWHEMSHVFSGYGPGVRYIRFTHGGQDTQFWAGHYGIRVTNSSVEISPCSRLESC